MTEYHGGGGGIYSPPPLPHFTGEGMSHYTYSAPGSVMRFLKSIADMYGKRRPELAAAACMYFVHVQYTIYEVNSREQWASILFLF